MNAFLCTILGFQKVCWDVISMYLATTTTQFSDTKPNGVQMQYKALRADFPWIQSVCRRGPHRCTITVRGQVDIPAAGGQIQLLYSPPANRAPTIGGLQVLQESCPNRCTCMMMVVRGGQRGDSRGCGAAVLCALQCTEGRNVWVSLLHPWDTAVFSKFILKNKELLQGHESICL